MATEDAGRRRRLRLWATVAVVVLAAALGVYLWLSVSGRLSPGLDVTVTLRNTGAVPIRGLSIDQRDGAGHSVVPTVAPGQTVSVVVTNDEHVTMGGLDLVDDLTGRNYALPPHQTHGTLRGAIDVEVMRATAAGTLSGRARSRTDSGADPAGWEPLRED